MGRLSKIILKVELDSSIINRKEAKQLGDSFGYEYLAVLAKSSSGMFVDVGNIKVLEVLNEQDKND